MVAVCGQEFTPELLERIQSRVEQEPTLSRRALSREVCQWLGWRSPDGRGKDMSCRVALGRLARRGLLRLPQVSAAVPPGAVRAAAPLPPAAPIEVPLEALGALELVLVGSRQSQAHARCRELFERYHYLGAGRLCGAQLRYLVVSEHHGVVGALAFSSAAWRLAARERHIGWSEAARVANLGLVVSNSRLLIVPQLRVPNLASWVLGACARRLPEDWAVRYGQRPVLLETFVERDRFSGSCYRAANWVHAGASGGRGRQDAAHRQALPVKDLYLYPLQPDWRARLCAAPAPPALPRPTGDWVEEEFGTARLGDARLEARLRTLAADFYARPRAQIPQACGSRAKTKAAYRFFDHESVSMDAILAPHYEATAARAAAEPVVLAVQDTTSLNYNAQPAIERLGPIGTTAQGTLGLMVHDTMAFTPAGLPLGLVEVRCWARDPSQLGKRALRHQLPIEQKESVKWLESLRAAARLQARCPHTTVVSVGDREADLYELFDLARRLEHAPKLLIRAESNRALTGEQPRLWTRLAQQPVAAEQVLELPRRGNRAARQARLAVSHAAVELKAPSRKAALAPVKMWAVWAREIEPAPGIPALDWMLLTTCEVGCAEQALERLAWYAARWGIEVYHRTLKSGCQIETRQLGSAERIEACLAIDLVVAWRILHLTRLGRETPEVPCSVYFAEAEWRALVSFIHRRVPAPDQAPPSLREATRMVASLGGFLGRKCDGEPGTQTLWLGLQRLDDLTEMFLVLTDLVQRSPPHTVSSG
jgi:hypothetical protein